MGVLVWFFFFLVVALQTAYPGPDMKCFMESLRFKLCRRFTFQVRQLL